MGSDATGAHAVSRVQFALKPLISIHNVDSRACETKQAVVCVGSFRPNCLFADKDEIHMYDSHKRCGPAVPPEHVLRDSHLALVVELVLD